MNPGPSELKIASPLLRGLAWFIDIAVMVVLGLILTNVLGDTQIAKRETYAALIVVWSLYFILTLAVLSTTIGKMAMGLCVTNQDGDLLTPDRAILRYMVFFIGGFLVVGTLVSTFLILVDSQRRAVHDIVARTRVVQGRPDLATRKVSRD